MNLPQLPCEACMADAARCTTTDRLAGVYCEHHRSGLHFANGLFVMYAPVSREEYAAILAALDVRAEQLEGLLRPTSGRPN